MSGLGCDNMTSIIVRFGKNKWFNTSIIILSSYHQFIVLYRRIEIIRMQEAWRNDESGQDQADRQLESLSRELWDSIQRAKWLYRSCKIGNYEDSEYVLTPSGVHILQARMWFALTTSAKSITTSSSGRNISRTRSTLPSSRIFPKRWES